MATDYRVQVEEFIAGHRRSRERPAETGQELAAVTETTEDDEGFSTGERLRSGTAERAGR